MPLSLRISIITIALASFISSAVGQVGRTPNFLNQQRQVEEEIRLGLDRTLPASQKVLLDWGGWYGSYIFLFNDGIEDRTLRRQDVRIWGSLNADGGIHQGYARLRMSYNDYNTHQSYDCNDDDFSGADLDRGWYQIDFSKFLRKHSSINLPLDLKVKAGRDYIIFGTGYALSMPLDSVQIIADVGDFEINTLLAKSISSYDNIDSSRIDSGRTDRGFYGIQLQYKGLKNHEPFVYYFSQNDRQKDINEFIFKQKWDYDSEYIGIGSVGQFTPTLRYSTELVYETGSSYGDKQYMDPNEIEAWGFDFLLTWMPNWKMSPTFSAEYMFASGDSDRLNSPTNAANGNKAYTTDYSFNGFGYRNTGLSLAPDLSNIHIWRLGGAFFPFEKNSRPWLRKMQLGADYFLYHKDKSEAAISDYLADQPNGYIGWEMDYYMNWRFTSDLALTTRFGCFFPGSAYSEQEARQFFLAGLTWNF
jgi:alginate export protein